MKRWLNRFRQRFGINLAQPQTSSPSIQPLTFQEAKFAILDIETTGLDPRTDEILALGAIRMIGARILVGQTLEYLVQPHQMDWGDTVPIHRILPNDVKTAPTLEAIIGSFARFCAGHILVGHSVWLDRAFLIKADASFSAYHWLDIVHTAKWLFDQNPALSQPNASLFSLAQQYDIPVPARHQALADAFIIAQIWQRQLTQLQRHGLTHLNHLAPLIVR
jgi:DNA polymerase-3 subunit epsilon